MNDQPQSDSIQVSCSFCAGKMTCPIDMLATSKKHMCFTCFQSNNFPVQEEDRKSIHVDIPLKEMSDLMASDIAEKLIEEVFPLMWSQSKESFKDLSKKEMAQQMFAQGAYLGIKGVLETMNEIEEKESEEGLGPFTRTRFVD